MWDLTKLKWELSCCETATFSDFGIVFFNLFIKHRPLLNIRDQRLTPLLIITFSPYTSHCCQWVSIDLLFQANRSRLTDHTLQLPRFLLKHTFKRLKQTVHTQQILVPRLDEYWARQVLTIVDYRPMAPITPSGPMSKR